MPEEKIHDLKFTRLRIKQSNHKNRSVLYGKKCRFCCRKYTKKTHTLKHNHKLFPQSASYKIHFRIQSTLLNIAGFFFLSFEIVKFSHNVNVDIEKNFRIVTWLFSYIQFFFLSYINRKIMYRFSHYTSQYSVYTFCSPKRRCYMTNEILHILCSKCTFFFCSFLPNFFLPLQI